MFLAYDQMTMYKTSIDVTTIQKTKSVIKTTLTELNKIFKVITAQNISNTCLYLFNYK